MGRSRLVVVIPAYNEQDTIAEVVAAASAYADVIVVNDCSTDDTANRAREAGAHVISNVTNQGYDGTLNCGIEEALNLGYEAAVTLDADGEHDPAVLAEFQRLLIDEAIPLVLGRRLKPARFAEYVYVWVMRIWLNIGDVLCGCKGYRLRLVDENGGFDHVGSTGTELAVASVRRGYAFQEVDVPGRDRVDTPRFGSILRANARILISMLRVIRYALAITPRKNQGKI